MRDFKKAAKTVLLFVLCVILLSVPLAHSYLFAESDVESDAKLRDKLAGTIDMIFCGGSQTKCGVDTRIMDEMLSVSSYNLSGTWQSNYASRLLLDRELARNDIKHVVLGVTLDTLTRGAGMDLGQGDYLMLPRLNGFSERFKYAVSEITLRELPTVCYELLHRGASLIKERLAGKYVSSVDPEEKGHVSFSSESVALMGAYEGRYHKTLLNTRFRAENAEALAELIGLCRQYGVEPVLLVVPFSDSFIFRNDGLDVFREYISDFAEQTGVEFIDMNLYLDRYNILTDEVSFHDEAHLSKVGSEAFSAVLSEVLSKIYAGEDVSYLFYKSYDEMEKDSPYFIR